MFYPPSLIVFVDSRITNSTRNAIVKQLLIDEYIDGTTFDGYVAADGYYASDIKKYRKRLLVIRPLDDYTNRSLADIVLCPHNGMISVEYNKYGPPGVCCEIHALTYGKLGIYMLDNVRKVLNNY